MEWPAHLLLVGGGGVSIMARKSLIQRERKRQKLEHKYHLIRRSSKKELSKVPS